MATAGVGRGQKGIGGAEGVERAMENSRVVGWLGVHTVAVEMVSLEERVVVLAEGVSDGECH